MNRIGPKAGRRMQVDATDSAPIGRPVALSPAPATVDAVAPLDGVLGPMANTGINGCEQLLAAMSVVTGINANAGCEQE